MNSGAGEDTLLGVSQADFKSKCLETEARPALLSLDLRRVLFIAFVLDLALVAFRAGCPDWLTGLSQAPESLLVILGLATTLSSLASVLPGQNVALAAVIIAGLSFGADLLSAAAGLPFAQRPGGVAPGNHFVWAIPLIRVFEILNSRAVAQRLLRLKQRVQNYGLWVLALTVVLAVLFDLNLQPYATVVSGHWSWTLVGNTRGWYGVPWLAAAAWASVALAITALVTPALINKRPGATTAGVRRRAGASTRRGEMAEPAASSSSSNGSAKSGHEDEEEKEKEAEVDEESRLPGSRMQFWAWISANMLFVAGAVSHGLWPATALITIELILVGALTLPFTRVETNRLPG